MCQKERDAWSQTYAWLSVSRKHMSKCNCIQAYTHAHTRTQGLIQVWTLWHSGTWSQTLSICQNLVWSQQNGTILFHSAWYRKRSPMTADHRTNVIPCSEVLCLNNWVKNKTNLFQCDFFVIGKLIDIFLFTFKRK
jgi:hypothetical protein